MSRIPEACQEPKHFKTYARSVDLVVCREEAGGYSAYVPTLPGVHSQGDDEFEAFANLEAALRDAVESYQDQGQEVPWVDPPLYRTVLVRETRR